MSLHFIIGNRPLREPSNVPNKRAHFQLSCTSTIGIEIGVLLRLCISLDAVRKYVWIFKLVPVVRFKIHFSNFQSAWTLDESSTQPIVAVIYAYFACTTEKLVCIFCASNYERKFYNHELFNIRNQEPGQTF